jgi:hypothetical protein
MCPLEIEFVAGTKTMVIPEFPDMKKIFYFLSFIAAIVVLVIMCYDKIIDCVNSIAVE